MNSSNPKASIAFSPAPPQVRAKRSTLHTGWGFPVALKINSPDILHKSDWGGVRLNLQSAGQLREAYAK